MGKKILKTLGCLLASIILVGIDQLVKYRIYNGIRLNGSHLVIPGILRFTYVENYGAAFNILTNQRWPLIVFALVLSAVLIVLIYRSFDKAGPKYIFWKRVSLVMILAGAVGNVIDRAAHVFVIDFIQVLFIEWPVFNIADCLIVVGCLLLLLIMILEDLEERKAKKTVKD